MAPLTGKELESISTTDHRTDGNDQASPLSVVTDYREDRLGNMCPIFSETHGLTKREYFAAKALQGLTAMYLSEHITGWSVTNYAIEAVELADALIYTLNKPH